MKTLIFDLGMVLVDFRWKAFLEDLGYDEDQVENLAGAVFKNPLWQQFDWGIMGDENVLAQMKLEAPKYETDIERIWDNFRYVCQPYSYSEELIRTLHEKGYKIYFLSNYGETLFHRGKQDYAFFKYLDGGVFSYEVQQMKPNDDIYQTLLDRYQKTRLLCRLKHFSAEITILAKLRQLHLTSVLRKEFGFYFNIFFFAKILCEFPSVSNRHSKSSSPG